MFSLLFFNTKNDNLIYYVADIHLKAVKHLDHMVHLDLQDL